MSESSKEQVCCAKNKAPFLMGLLGFLLVGWLLLAVADRIGLGVSSVFSKRSITVTGSANRLQANQMASFSATFTNKNADKAAAMNTVNDKSKALIQEVKNMGIADEDIKTQNLNVYRDQTPYWDSGVQKYKDGDWVANLTTDITLRDVKKVDALTELLGKTDATNVWGPNYSLNESEPEKSALLKQAYDNAKAKADSLATGMGMKVGRVITIAEGSAVPSQIYDVKAMGMGGGGGGTTPGSTNVSTSVTVTFELK